MTTTDLAELDEVEAINRVIERLKGDYRTVDPSVIEAAVTVAHSRMNNARIRTFVPIFVEREARTALSEIAP